MGGGEIILLGKVCWPVRVEKFMKHIRSVTGFLQGVGVLVTEVPGM